MLLQNTMTKLLTSLKILHWLIPWSPYFFVLITINYNNMGNCIRYVLSLFTSFSIHRISGKKLREVRQLAEGGYGFVSLVEDVQTGRQYAMKKLLCQTPQQKQMYYNEVSVMKELSHCPHVIGYHGSHEIQRDGYLQAYILMEYCPRTVYDMLVESQKHGTLKMSEFQILKILRDTALGLQEMHSVGILHQDVKVQNILLTTEGVAKLCDFGSCSKEKVDLATVPKSKIYKYEQRFQKNTTLMYRPPEMIDMYLKYPVDQRVDIWMLGCVLFVMNYRYHPFQQQGKLSIVNASIKYPPGATEKMQDFMRHMLTPNPYFRPCLKDIIRIIDTWQTQNFQLNQVAIRIKQNERHLKNQNYDQIQTPQWHKLRPEQEWNDFTS